MKIIQILIGLTLLQIDSDRQNSSPVAESPSSNLCAAEGTGSDEVSDARPNRETELGDGLKGEGGKGEN